MKKRILSFVLILATMFSLFAIYASAAKQEEYISEVALVYEDSVEEARAAIAGTDWKLYEKDLNPNADYMFDDGVYLIYKTSTNVEDAITDLRVMDMYGGYSTANYKKQLEASRKAYMTAVSYIRIAVAEFKELYAAGDDMAKLAYRQMNYYKDIGETNMLMGDFLLNVPSDQALVTVLMEGNAYVVTNLITLLAIGISGGSNGTLAERITANYAKRDTFTDTTYNSVAELFFEDFREIAALVKRYDALSDRYDLTDEDIGEEEAEFLVNYATLALTLEQIPYGEGTLKDFLAREDLTLRDLYPILAAFTEGQLALADIGVLDTVFLYSSPSASIKDLYQLVEQTEREITENGTRKTFDVYTGVDRSIFTGDFAVTTDALRQQALTGTDWTKDFYLDEKAMDNIPVIAVASVASVGVAAMIVPTLVKMGIKRAIDTAVGYSAKALVCQKWAKVISFLSAKKAVGDALVPTVSGVKILAAAGIALVVTAVGIAGVSVWYGYYNPDYTPIPDTMIDVKVSDIGDKYVKYTAAKVYGDENGKNADLNAYQGKEWNALYYTKDATAGKCLLPTFVCSDNDASVARRHQGISLFGETQAFNLNSNVFSKDAPGVYVTVRYSTAKKAAADVPSVVGSIFATGAPYAVTALSGAIVGVGVMMGVGAFKKKRLGSSEEN